MDNIDELKSSFIPEVNTMIDSFDKNFLQILSKAYSFRYMDNISEEVGSVGFYINQFLGEMDRTIYILQHSVKVQPDPLYIKDIHIKNPALFSNNWCLNNIPRTEFMNRETTMWGFGYFTKTKVPVNVTGTRLPDGYKYDNIMLSLNMEAEQEQPENTL